MEEEKKEPRLVSRRQFLFGASAFIAATAVVGFKPVTALASESASSTIPMPVQSLLAEGVRFSVAPSMAYLVVDPEKCAGCMSCMLACSMVHEKKASISTSRIQIVQTPLVAFPADLDIYQCRQCTEPLCVDNCPTGACHLDAANGNVRVIDQDKCIGCQTCLNLCPHPAHRAVWNAETKKATKCDLCIDAPYLGQKGGLDGKQACVLACPMGALAVVTEVPSQKDDTGYRVNMRKDA